MFQIYKYLYMNLTVGEPEMLPDRATVERSADPNSVSHEQAVLYTWTAHSAHHSRHLARRHQGHHSHLVQQ